MPSHFRAIGASLLSIIALAALDLYAVTEPLLTDTYRGHAFAVDSWMITFDTVTVSRRRPSGESFSVLDHVSFTIPAGRRVAIIGRSGAGKTTMLRLINRLDNPDAGSISIGEVDIREIDPPHLRRRVGMLFQQPRLFDATIRENLDRPLLLAGRHPLTEATAISALRDVDLPATILGSHSRDLSLGQQQRVALARALVLEPEILLLDEPTSALDPQSADVILALLRTLQVRRTMTMLLVTHLVEHARTFADGFLALRDGAVRLGDTLESATDWALADNSRQEYGG